MTFDEFIRCSVRRSYLDAALWSSCEDGMPLDHWASEDGAPARDCLAPEALARMATDVAAFLARVDPLDWEASGLSEDFLGRNFWLTRNRHGTGFWDNSLEDLGDSLTAISHSFAECDFYLGSDGLFYLA